MIAMIQRDRVAFLCTGAREDPLWKRRAAGSDVDGTKGAVRRFVMAKEKKLDGLFERKGLFGD